MRDQPIERLDHARGLPAVGADVHRAAQRDHAAHALGRLVRRVQREHAAQAPADEADLAAASVVDVAHLLLERECVLALEADVAAEAPGLDVATAVAQEDLEREQRGVVADESGEQQHRMAVTPRSAGQQRQRPGQRRHLEERAALDQAVQRMRGALVRMPCSHRCARL